MTERDKAIDDCLAKIAEQRCQRGTPWDNALVNAMNAIRSMRDLEKKAMCSCKASQRDGQHMEWCPAISGDRTGERKP